MVVTSTAPPPTRTAPFPVAAVEVKLRDELIEAVIIETSIRGISLPSSPLEVSKTAVHVDSLVVVAILCAVEPIVGFELSDSVVRSGGYPSVESALGHLMPGLEKEWTKKKGAKP
jgi:hypothetical protein